MSQRHIKSYNLCECPRLHIAAKQKRIYLLINSLTGSNISMQCADSGVKSQHSAAITSSIFEPSLPRLFGKFDHQITYMSLYGERRRKRLQKARGHCRWPPVRPHINFRILARLLFPVIFVSVQVKFLLVKLN